MSVRTKFQMIVAICLMLVLIAIVIHPDFDIPNARAKRGIAATMFAPPVAGLKPFSAIIYAWLFAESIAISCRTTRKFSLPLLC